MPTGTVYLIGAGPGDPELITLKAKRCLEAADIVVYDYLANEKLLNYVKPDAECIYVGKKAGQHTMKQEDMNALLVELAHKHASVVRLKGGDPFVFGRGGEEALELAANQIPFEIVPGIPAAIGATAYAGIPITHRAVATSVAFITGHEAEKSDNSASVDWDIIGKSCDTLVIYMGVKNLPRIVQKLKECGRSPDTPVALIYRGTYLAQKTVTGTLETIVQKAEEYHITPPSLIVVGDVVGLRKQLSWFENRPLFGKTVAVTRNKTSEAKLTKLLEAQGAQVLHFPTIDIIEVTPNPQLEDALKNLSSYDWLIFTSGNAVDIFFDTLFRAGHDVRALSNIKIAAIGKPSAGRLAEYHLTADVIPTVFTSEKLVDEMTATVPLSNKRILFPGSNLSNPEIADRLRQVGAMVDVISVYETRIAQVEPGRVANFTQRIESQSIDWITFTSSSTVENFVSIVGQEFLDLYRETLPVASIGPVTTETLEKHGLPPRVSAAEHSFAGLVQALIHAKTSDFRKGG
jgi:uroporphyrinogen III methyltransferase/synthase